MVRMIRLQSLSLPEDILVRTPNGDCIGLFTRTEVKIAQYLAPKHGCILVRGSFDEFIEPRQRRSDQNIVGIVIFKCPLEETPFTSATPRQLLRGLCHAIEARSCMIASAKVNKRKPKRLKPWMTQVRTWFGRGFMAPSWY